MSNNVAKIHTASTTGLDGHLIDVECDVTKGLPAFGLVGLANKSIDESKERVKSALNNSSLTYPSKKITVNLAPAQIPKHGTHYDLPIAIAILTSSKQLLEEDVKDSSFLGELALDGAIRPVSNIITLTETLKNHAIKKVYVPFNNYSQAKFIKNIEVIPVKSLKELFLILKKQRKPVFPIKKQKIHENDVKNTPRLDDVMGQMQTKRALIIAAAGRHNMLMSGSPGSGKTMLSKILPSLLPEMNENEKLMTTKIHSLDGGEIHNIISNRPFRAPHHTASKTSLIGGGVRAKPGEISLAHLGVLLLDEIPEYPRNVLEALRQPLEDKIVSITRANARTVFPADFLLVATMNPCPCGFYGDTEKECNCSVVQINNYQNKLSGPFLDRIDMKITVNRVAHKELLAQNTLENKQQLEAKNLIKKAQEIQSNRYKSSDKNNANVSTSELKQYMRLDTKAEDVLLKATHKLQLSARSTYKVIKVARTIADLDVSEKIEVKHITESLQYR